MLVRDAMLADSITAAPDESFESLIKRLVKSRQATAAVIDEDRRLLGLVGVHDILRRVVPHYLDLDTKLAEVMHDTYFEDRLDRLKDTHVSDLMQTEIDCVSPDDALIKAVVFIVAHRRKTLPVIEAERFIGMVTRRSILDLIVDRYDRRR